MADKGGDRIMELKNRSQYLDKLISVQDMEVSSLKKKFKDKKFAAGCSREVIERGAELCGLMLEELWQQTLDAMRSCENSINRQMEEI